MSTIDGSRFLWLLQIDVVRQWKKIWISTAAVFGIALIIYIANADPQASARPALYIWMFPVLLLGGGLLFTSTVFSDLHDALQRFTYLTLPCSNPERFLSRYVLTAPLYYLYALVLYALFDVFAAWVAQSFVGGRAVPFAPFEPAMLTVTLVYFGVHAVMFCGAIFFRSHAAVKTVVTVMLIGTCITVVQLIVFRIFYWSYFQSLFLPVHSGIPTPAIELPSRAVVAIALAFSVWVLYIAYQCLRDHEVQGEL